MSSTLINLIVQLIAGAVGGNAVGAAAVGAAVAAPYYGGYNAAPACGYYPYPPYY